MCAENKAALIAPGFPIAKVATGTPAGVGNGRNPKLFMKQGDIIEVEITKIGVLRNTVVDE